MANEQSSSLQWIETYVIRYTIGTIFGAVIIYLLCSRHPNLIPLLLGVGVTKIENSHMLLLLAYGLSFCYIASGPVLILHAGRFYLKLVESFSTSQKTFNNVLLFVVPFSLPLSYVFIENHSFTDINFWPLFLASFIIFGQYFVIAHILYYKNDLYVFYEKLSEARTNDKNHELVSSYRKLKDHGNAFMILFCELALGILFEWTNSFGDMSNFVSLVLLLIWIVPSAAIWIGATSIELNLVYKKSE